VVPEIILRGWIVKPAIEAQVRFDQQKPRIQGLHSICGDLTTDPKPGFDQQKESIDDDTIDIDVELYETVDDIGSYSDINMLFALLICFGHLCHGYCLLSFLAMQGETENKDIVDQDESFMDIDSAECGLGEPAWSNRIC
jgi:hypothetical protein